MEGLGDFSRRCDSAGRLGSVVDIKEPLGWVRETECVQPVGSRGHKSCDDCNARCQLDVDWRCEPHANAIYAEEADAGNAR